MNIEDYLTTDCWFNYRDFYDFISTKKFKKLVEVGVWKGHSISYLAKLNQESEIFAVDLFENTTDPYYGNHENLKIQIPHIYEIYNKYLEKENTRNLIKDIKSNSWEAASHFNDEELDFVFIDADHSYECVKKDINSWYPKIKTNGILSGHDYGAWGSVTMAVNEFAKEKNYTIQQSTGGVWYLLKK